MEFPNLMSQKSETESLGVFELDPASNSGENVEVSQQMYFMYILVHCTACYRNCMLALVHASASVCYRK